MIRYDEVLHKTEDVEQKMFAFSLREGGEEGNLFLAGGTAVFRGKLVKKRRGY